MLHRLIHLNRLGNFRRLLAHAENHGEANRTFQDNENSNSNFSLAPNLSSSVLANFHHSPPPRTFFLPFVAHGTTINTKLNSSNNFFKFSHHPREVSLPHEHPHVYIKNDVRERFLTSPDIHRNIGSVGFKDGQQAVLDPKIHYSLYRAPVMGLTAMALTNISSEKAAINEVDLKANTTSSNQTDITNPDIHYSLFKPPAVSFLPMTIDFLKLAGKSMGSILGKYSYYLDINFGLAHPLVFYIIL